MANSERTKLCETPTNTAHARLISVEPIYFFVLAIQAAIITARSQYVQQRIAQDYNYTLPQRDNCSLDNGTEAMEERIQSETATWVMWMACLSTLIPIFTGPILVASSDSIGRKPVLIISAISYFLAAAVILAVAYFRLSLIYMLVGKAIFGIFGDTAVPAAVSLAYISDSTTTDMRMIKIAIFEFSSYLGFSVGHMLVGVILQETHDFVLAFAFATVLAIINLIYTAFPGIVLETVQKCPTFHPIETLKYTFHQFGTLCSVTMAGRRWRISLLLLMRTCLYIVSEGALSVATIVGLGKPFCWSPMTVSIYSTLVHLIPGAVVAVLIKPLGRCISEHWLLHIGVITFMGQMFTTALATNTFQFLYLATLIGCLRTMPPTVVKVLLSKLAGDNDKGSVFAVFSLVASVGIFTAPLLTNGIYSYTVTIGQPRLIFYISIAILVIPILANSILQIVPMDKPADDQIELKPHRSANGSVPETDDSKCDIERALYRTSETERE